MISKHLAWAAAMIIWLGVQTANAQEYDPLTVKDTAKPSSLELDVHDSKRSRDIPLRVYLPEAKSPAPVVIFSHGLGGSRDNNAYLGNHLAARGYVVVFTQHAGSDERVWKDVSLGKRLTAMRDAASGKNLVLRCEDITATIDQIELWHKDNSHPLAGRIDLSQIGMSGHSFGALTTQNVSGQAMPIVGQKLTDPRIRAAIMYSPSSPASGRKEAAFAKVTVPWLLMTGTKDSAPVGNQTVESRLEVFPYLPASIDRFELVLFDAEHSAFSERAVMKDRAKRNPNHHRVILGLSTAFWDTYLKSDTKAKEWLTGDGARSLLEADDRWQLQLK